MHNRFVHHKYSTNSLFGCIAQVKTAVYITRMCKSERREFGVGGGQVVARLAILYQCLQRSYLPYANMMYPIHAPSSDPLHTLNNSIQETSFLGVSLIYLQMQEGLGRQIRLHFPLLSAEIRICFFWYGFLIFSVWSK